MASSESNSDTGFHCPCCAWGNMIIKQTEYNVDHFGSVLLSLTVCPKCGYKSRDILPLETREPTLIKARIDSLSDLDIKVIKSVTATIRIPEFGAAITPGPNSEGFITNVEGVLARMEDVLTFMLSSAEPEKVRSGERILEQIHKARESEPRFTIIIEDPFGNSSLVSSDPSKIEKRNLTKNELKEIKFGQHVLDSHDIVSH